jgi:hypothetical protein
MPAQVGSRKPNYESERAIFDECIQKCARKPLDRHFAAL